VASDLQPASLGEPATAALVVGCWYLRWEGGPFGAGAPAGEAPDSVRLRDEVVFGTRERLVAPATHPTGRSADGRGVLPWEARFVLNRWWIEDGALRLRFSDGEREEWEATLGVTADELVGVVTFREDAAGAGLTARRIECDF